MLNLIIFLIYVFWGLCSLFAQSENYLRVKVKSRDFFNLLPNYKFFCPTPLRVDYHLFYRYKRGTGTFSDWIPIPIGDRNSLTCVLWNPLKRDRKVFFKIVETIKRQSAKGKVKRIGPLYSMLLQYIRAQAGLDESCFIQFRITRARDYAADFAESDIYVSLLHQASLPHASPLTS